MNEQLDKHAKHGLPQDEVAVAAYFIWQHEGCPHGKDQQHWDFAIQQLLVGRIAQLEAALVALSPQQRSNLWGQFRLNRHAIRLVTEESLKDTLANRLPDGRDQAADNRVVIPLSDAIIRATAQGDYRLAAELFREGYAQILGYESEHKCEVHKGALAFDVARAYLQSWDFFAAMHYFELAQHETRLTDANPTFSIYDFGLFEKNFWDTLHIDTTKHPIPVYQEFWGTPYAKASALEDYGALSDDSKLAYIVASAVRIRLQHIADHSGWEGSDALRLGYWALAADLARLIEVEAKIRSSVKQDTLFACLLQGFNNTVHGKVSSELNRLHGKYDIAQNRAIANYEKHFDAILREIRDNTKPRFDRLCHALYLLGVTRNQVAHRLDKSTKLFKQLDDARYLADLFLALCRVDDWKNV